ncbi:MAG: hypothetical protein QSU88_12145, partial [Candidatus Methanoperedens sp.]|nr:hypothetical protein [Candidatus Methanoperedens sp.]
LIGCPVILLFMSSYFGVHFGLHPGSFDILTETRFLLDGTRSFITGLDYLNWKTYLFLYFALTLGAGAAPSRTDIISMLPGLIVIVTAFYALNYFGFEIQYLNIIFSSLSASLSITIIPLLAVAVIIGILELMAVVKS